MNRNPLLWGDNEKIWIRIIRTLVFTGAAAGAVAIAAAIPSVDFPGRWDATIVAVAVPALLGADKWLRRAK